MHNKAQGHESETTIRALQTPYSGYPVKDLRRTLRQDNLSYNDTAVARQVV